MDHVQLIYLSKHDAFPVREMVVYQRVVGDEPSPVDRCAIRTLRAVELCELEFRAIEFDDLVGTL